MNYTAFAFFLILFTSISFVSCQDNHFVQGKRIYSATCANCHMDDGNGLGQMFPPIANSDYYRNNKEEIACIIKHGLQGTITVNGIQFNETMPANKKFTNTELANLINYINFEWYKETKPVNLIDIANQLKNCSEASK